MKEEYLFTGPLESTNQPYAVAKLAGIIQCDAYNHQYGTRYLAVMPTNLYGPNDNYDLQNSHVLPAFIRKFHLAKLAVEGEWDDIRKDESYYGPIPMDFYGNLRRLSEKNGHGHPSPSRNEKKQKNNSSEETQSPKAAVPIWGTGNAYREFLHVDDMADACLFIMNLNDPVFDSLCTGRFESMPDESLLPLINIGIGSDQTISELADRIAKIIGYNGEVIWDQSMPDGMPKKMLDSSRLVKLGWGTSISLTEGVKRTYQSYKEKIVPASKTGV